MSAITESLSSQTVTPEVIFPPGNLWSDEPPLESDLHREQIDLLIRLLKWQWREQQDFYVSGNLTIYYSPNQKKSEDFRGPDFFVVLGATSQERRSWVVWQEGGKYPNVIVELLSDSTATVDRGLKKELYQNTWRVPEYFWFHPDTLEFQGFRLVNGLYEGLEPTSEGWRWSQQLHLYLGIHERQLRFFTPEGRLVPLPEQFAEYQTEQERQRAERAETALEQEHQRAEQEHQRAEQERQRAERLAQRLQDLGIEE
ncbi:MAG: Uma2 family endonuclease [Acaryochloridaceae cyanobacterium RU_4_10]|nr:Uma2 family endonuclease [Acaryochloridaceae cyanobacterium RU_4_10]